MEIHHVALVLATFLCSLVAGFLFAFSVVAMPGIQTLKDRDFIRAFQVMDRVIQNNQPVFLLVWIGSVVALLIAAVLGLGPMEGARSTLLAVATLAYLLGVQAPTIAVNIPLNNRLQAVDVDAVGTDAHRVARLEFEARWNQWNVIRTVVACLTSALLTILLYLQ